MANRSLWNAPEIVPSLPYSDLPRAVEWFERVFGFRERVEARLTWPGGGRAWLEVGGGLFSITAAGEAGHDPKAGAPGLVMKVYVEDVDKHFARAKAAGAKIISELEDGFWGGRIYRVLDHEGYMWQISQRGRDWAADRWQLPPGVTRGVPK